MKAQDFRADLARYEQLRLAIGEEDLEDEGQVSPAEARARSEAARLALEALPNPQPLPDSGRGEEAPPSNLPPNSKNSEGDNGGIPWLEEWRRLIGQGWKWRTAAWIAWAASPKVGRWPATQMELATEVLGLTSDRTIIAARKKNPAIDEMVGVMQAAPLMEHIRDINEALAESAQIRGRNGNPDRKLAYEMLHLYQPKVRVEQGTMLPDKCEDMTAEQLAEMKAGLEERISLITAEETEDEVGGDASD
jgi:hypothetical protein